MDVLFSNLPISHHLEEVHHVSLECSSDVDGIVFYLPVCQTSISVQTNKLDYFSESVKMHLRS